MDYLKILHENPDLADELDSMFDFFQMCIRDRGSICASSKTMTLSAIL